MKCVRCDNHSPENVLAIHSVWTCPECNTTPKLQEELNRLYKQGAGKYLYVSELTNNLDKVNQYFVENMELNNPNCTITLSTPEGCGLLRSAYDGVYLDKNSVTQEHLMQILLTEHGWVKWVCPTTQVVE